MDMVKLSLVVCAAGVMPLKSLAIGPPPYFTQQSPESVYVNLNAGQNSFECTGTAVHAYPWETVHLYTAPPPSFVVFEPHDGNPATFRLYAENLNYSHLGGYIVTVGAENPFGAQNGGAARFVISIVPEPGMMGLLCLSILPRRRRP